MRSRTFQNHIYILTVDENDQCARVKYLLLERRVKLIVSCRLVAAEKNGYINL